jgi:pre-mRNA-splicing factor CDC5/CEF1
MVRLILKGGIWKNSEDEILKAAIMKYGLNQWARVASLLPRKTAATCKARWFEWLDPSIRKTEWTREEEERLLHLAKLMPSQWRTISPLVGRTAAQCIEHYERLLDAAQSKDDEKSSSKQDHTKLRPGEIDPMPEVKPARPDPVDMDEDEKEMLSEARARLANTKGKKAKRKVRERMLDEARHLASLQKARELKAAGIESKKRPRRPTDGIDYANEIPFERRAPVGFFDTSQEDAKFITDKAAETDDFKITLLNNIETKRRSEEEAIEREKDKKKIRGAISRNLPAALVAEAEKDPLNVRKRAKLALPVPMMTESDMEEAARIGAAIGSSGGFNLESGDSSAESVVTRGLVGSYSVNPNMLMTSTLLSRGNGPSASSSREAILEEARNQRTLRAQETPLLGGENADLEGGTGFSGSTPFTRNSASGRVMGGEKESSTPFLSHNLEFEGRGGRSGASIIGGSSVVSGTGSSVVFRDALGINRVGPHDGGSVFGDSASAFGDGVSVRDSIDGLLQRELAEKMLQGLRSLPKPKGSYEFMVPYLPSDKLDEDSLSSIKKSSSGSFATVPDAREEEVRTKKIAEAARLLEFSQQTAVIRCVPELPRPIILDDDAIAPPVGDGNNYFAIAEGMINDELLSLLKSDAFKYPVSFSSFFFLCFRPLPNSYSKAR